MKEEALYVYRGKTKIGWNIVFSWTAGGFGSIRFLQDKIIVSTFPFRKTIPYSKIKKLSWSTAGYVKIEHNDGGASYVAFWILGKDNPELNKIYKILKDKGVSN